MIKEPIQPATRQVAQVNTMPSNEISVYLSTAISA
jgi:hypothetical protein